jgi:penicillin-binding protein 2
VGDVADAAHRPRGEEGGVNDVSRLRLMILGALVFSLPVTLLGRLWYLQGLAGASYTAAVQRQDTSTVATVAPRGLIVDDVGEPLATNVSALVVSAESTELPPATIGTGKNAKPNPARALEMSRLANVLGIPAATLDATATLCDYKDYGANAPKKNPGCWTGSPLQPIPLDSIDNSDPTSEAKATAVALAVLERQELYKGITAQLEEVRRYPAPQNASAAQLIGNVGKITSTDIDKAATPAQAKLLTTMSGVGGVIGQAGLEAEYNSYLEGTMGSVKEAINSAGEPTSTISTTPAVPGDELVSSIDAKVQKIAEQALADGVKTARSIPQLENNTLSTQRADAAAAIVMDNTGHVIAAANYPSYDPGVWDGDGISSKVYKQLQSEPGDPLFSQAIQGEYAPGSTFKVITTAGAVTTPYYSLNGTYECPAVFSAGNRQFQNFEGESGKGNISFADALKISCDTFFYSIANTLWTADGGINPKNPKDALINEAKLWGLGKDTGVDLPIDASGTIVTRQDLIDSLKKNRPLYCAEAKTEKNPQIRADDVSNCETNVLAEYQVGDELNFALGQGTVTASPLQMAAVYAAIGNGGTLYSPRFGKAILGPDGSVVTTITAPSSKLAVPASVLDYERAALQTVVTDPDGTASAAFTGFPFGQYTVAGKTGTAEVQAKNTDGSQKDDTAWFDSFGGPTADPNRYTVVVMVSQGGQGGVTAAPIARQIYDGLFGLNGDPTEKNYSTDDMYAAIGPAQKGAQPPTALPSLAIAPVAAASSAAPGSSAAPNSPAASAAGSTGSPLAIGADAGLLAVRPDRRSGSRAWVR